MDEEARAADHLRTLSICHYVYAALAACGSCLGGLYIGFALLITRLPDQPAQAESDPMDEGAKQFVQWFLGGFGVAIVVVALTLAVLCFLSARGLSRRENRTLSLVVAGVCCLTGLLGIVLGVFTFIVLSKPETQRLYARSAPV
jgi:type IV secretory pathway VirB2 component (pilin)